MQEAQLAGDHSSSLQTPPSLPGSLRARGGERGAWQGKSWKQESACCCCCCLCPSWAPCTATRHSQLEQCGIWFPYDEWGKHSSWNQVNTVNSMTTFYGLKCCTKVVLENLPSKFAKLRCDFPERILTIESSVG